MRHRGNFRRAAPWLLLALPAAVTVGAIAKAVGDGSTRRIDSRLRRRIQTLRSPNLDAVSSVLVPLTAPAFLITASLGLAFALRRRGRRTWFPIAISPFAAMLAGATFSATLPQQLAPSATDGKREPSFPSGHTTGATAEAFTAAYILRREGFLGPLATTALLMTPLIGGFNRLYRDRHWATDIAAGLSAGACIAAMIAMVSESTAGLPEGLSTHPSLST
jgi:undecaprenyl-diphosphatase